MEDGAEIKLGIYMSLSDEEEMFLTSLDSVVASALIQNGFRDRFIWEGRSEPYGRSIRLHLASGRTLLEIPSERLLTMSADDIVSELATSVE